MKKSIIVLGAVAVVLLMMSSAIAVPQKNSKTLMDFLDDLEQTKALLEEKSADKSIKPDGGWLDLIIKILTIIYWILKILDFFDLLPDLPTNAAVNT